MDAINRGAAAINDGIDYLRSNAWSIALLLGLWFYVRPKVVEAMENAKINRNPEKVKEYDNDLRRVRELQQKQAEQEAKAKAQELAEKKAARLAEERKAAKEKKAKQTTSGSYSKSTSSNAKPNLSINNFSTPSYRPARRTARRGWG